MKVELGRGTGCLLAGSSAPPSDASWSSKVGGWGSWLSGGVVAKVEIGGDVVVVLLDGVRVGLCGGPLLGRSFLARLVWSGLDRDGWVLGFLDLRISEWARGDGSERERERERELSVGENPLGLYMASMLTDVCVIHGYEILCLANNE